MEIVNGTETTYLYVQGQPFAIHKKSGESEIIDYLHLDYQGSIMAITNQSGTILEERNGVYAERSRSNAWGIPITIGTRNPNTLEYVLPNPFGSGSEVKRGYTFHEHLEEFNLINMNGRVYDPLLARFLNADPLIQDNTDAQNFNRYSYVLNNPTKYTDPSGYAYNGIGSNYTIGGVSDDAARNFNHDQQIMFNDYWTNFFDSPRERGGSLVGDASSSGSPIVDGYGRPLTEAEKAAYVAQYGGRAPNSEFVVTSGVYGANKWNAGGIGRMQASFGDASPYYQNQAKYTGRAQGGGDPNLGAASATGIGLYSIGQPIEFLKDVAALGSQKGSSVLSYTMSNLFPGKSPKLSKIQYNLWKEASKVLGKNGATWVVGGTGNIAGRIVGRWLSSATSGIGIGLIVYDVGRVWFPATQSGIGGYNQNYPSNDPNNLIYHICFVKGTQVHTVEGFRPIEQLKAGDTVYTFNLESQKIETGIIDQTIQRQTSEIYQLTTDSQKIQVTAEHPFYVVNKGWIKVKDLKKGDVLKTSNDQEIVAMLKQVQNTVTVYNIEVNGNHNYFVTQSKILVHNKSIVDKEELCNE